MVAALAGRLAFWLADSDLHAPARAAFERITDRGRYVELLRREADAGALALSGQLSEAVALFRDTVRRAQKLDVPVDLAFDLHELASVVGPDSPDGAEALAEGREILVRLRAEPIVRLLGERDPVVARTLSGAPAQPAATIARTKAPTGS